VVLTENAPPLGFSSIAVPVMDSGLNNLSGWHYEVLLEFDGVFAGTPRRTAARTKADVWFNQLGTARRVVLETSGDLLGQETPGEIEAVRLGNDYFLVRDDTCLTNANSDAEAAANLSVGSLIGGVNRASVLGQKAVINGENAWLYGFNIEDMITPNIRFGDNARVLDIQGEFWYSPEHQAVIRYYLNMEIENTNLFGSPLPVTGTLIIRYDLFDIGIVPNINVPFGC
jgi:hypothetical protein